LVDAIYDTFLSGTTNSKSEAVLAQAVYEEDISMLNYLSTKTTFDQTKEPPMKNVIKWIGVITAESSAGFYKSELLAALIEIIRNVYGWTDEEILSYAAQATVYPTPELFRLESVLNSMKRWV